MLHHAGTSELYTQRLHLRPYRPGDETAMFRNWASDPEVTRFMTWEPHASPAVTKGLVDMWVEGYESPTVYRWGIECKLDRSGTWIDVCNYAILEGDRPQLP